MMTTEEKLLEAEGDLERLVTRATNCLPTLKRAIEDARGDWNRDVRTQLTENLERAIDQAKENQLKRSKEKTE